MSISARESSEAWAKLNYEIIYCHLVWLFGPCFMQFNSKLEEQRSVSRQASPRSATFGELSGGPKDTRSQSLPPMPAATGPSSSSGRKKVTVPSLGNSGYTFGSASPTTYTAEDPAPNEPPMSPYSESGPTATNTEQPAGPFAGHQSAMRGSTPPPSSASAPASSLQQPPPQSPRRGSVWNQSFGTKPHHDRRGPHVDSSSDLPPDEPSPRQASGVPAAANAASAPTTPIGIPLNYNLGRRTSVSAESLDPSQATPMAKTVIPKSASQRARIEASIKGNLLFRNLDDEQHADVLNAMKEVRVPENTEVIVQGAVGDFFYVVESGQFEVWVKPPASHRYDPATRRTIADQAPAKMVARIEAGGSFGELALMYNAPRAATVVSTSPSSTLWALDRVTFRSILMEHTSRKRKMYEHFLGEVNILVSLETHERAKIADALEEKVYEEGEAVVIEGEVGKNFYIIESGTAQVLKRSPEGHDEEVSTLGRGDYFGGALHDSIVLVPSPCFDTS